MVSATPDWSRREHSPSIPLFPIQSTRRDIEFVPKALGKLLRKQAVGRNIEHSQTIVEPAASVTLFTYRNSLLLQYNILWRPPQLCAANLFYNTNSTKSPPMAGHHLCEKAFDPFATG